MNPMEIIPINSLASVLEKRRAEARRVDLFNGDDFKCALLGSMGFSTRLIMRHTGLTESQVGYRLRKGAIRRTDYRNGDSPLAESMLRRARVVAIGDVRRHLRQVVGKAG